MGDFFVRRPIVAMVIAIFMVIMGVVFLKVCERERGRGVRVTLDARFRDSIHVAVGGGGENERSMQYYHLN